MNMNNKKISLFIGLAWVIVIFTLLALLFRSL